VTGAPQAAGAGGRHSARFFKTVPDIKCPVSKDLVPQLVPIGIEAVLIDRMNVVALFALEEVRF
jgi:hypothetical protein